MISLFCTWYISVIRIITIFFYFSQLFFILQHPIFPYYLYFLLIYLYTIIFFANIPYSAYPFQTLFYCLFYFILSHKSTNLQAKGQTRWKRQNSYKGSFWKLKFKRLIYFYVMSKIQRQNVLVNNIQVLVYQNMEFNFKYVFDS